MAQWVRIHLPMQGTQARSLVQEDPSCCGQLSWCAAVTAHALEPVSRNFRACVLQLLKPVPHSKEERPVDAITQQRLSAAKNKCF